MPSKLVLVFYIPRENKYSFNALFGASEDLLENLPFVLCKSPDELFSTLSSHASEKILLFLSFCTTQIFEIEELIAELRSRHSFLRIIAGGPHPSGDPEGTLQMGVDIVVRGEGEYLMRDVLYKLISERSLENLNKKAIVEARPLMCLDEFQPVSFKYKMLGPIEITRGCPFRCIYCQTPRLFSGRPRHRSPEAIFSLVRRFKERGLRDMRFISPDAFSYGSRNGITLNLQALESLLKGIRLILGKDGRIFFGTFPSEVRPEHVTPETLGLIKKYCNNDNIVIGAQSGSERLLRFLKRGHSVEDVKRAVMLCRDYKIKVNVDFIFGLPSESEKDQFETLKLMQEIVDNGGRVHAHYFLPLPGTPLQDTLPSPLSDKLLSAINSLLPSGKLFGQWAKQMEFTKRLMKRRTPHVSKKPY